MALGQDFRRLWVAYATSAAGTWLALDAFPFIAVTVLHSTTTQVSVLAAAGLAVGSLIAVPLGPWLEFRRKRPVLVAMDAVRFLVLLTLPLGYWLDGLTFGHLLAVSVAVAAADIVFTAGSGAYLKGIATGEDLLAANARFETTQWTATAVGPPSGGALIGVFGPVTTVLIDGVSYLLSALAIGSIRTPEAQPAARPEKVRTIDILDGWRYILGHRRLAALFFNTALVNGLIMATAPLLAVLLLRELGFSPLEYGLAFGVPCLGGLLGSRLSRRVTARLSAERVLLWFGTGRACWPVLLAFTPHGAFGLGFVMLVEFGLILTIGIFNPVSATYRLQETETSRAARVLTAWGITTGGTRAALILGWGVLGAWLGTREAIGLAGVLLLLTPVLLWQVRTTSRPPRPPRSRTARRPRSTAAAPASRPGP
ncbi:MFS transporter [Amycolatopsis sp. FDAARGOS 1241]|uniref:MFS transporter n=1 Tax=Amycolatopsis sp. FDAARGOS 1241 TaxID=2778070 RepID=UPI001EF338E6|nr:MFS transporter [Amycolatopsis sp. FDAARGOS 1241]